MQVTITRKGRSFACCSVSLAAFVCCGRLSARKENRLPLGWGLSIDRRAVSLVVLPMSKGLRLASPVARFNGRSVFFERKPQRLVEGSDPMISRQREGF